MKSPRLLASLSLALAALLLVPCSSVFAKPNVLVILADDLGWGELSCQGFTEQILTPNIDSIAKNGVRFTDGYVSVLLADAQGTRGDVGPVERRQHRSRMGPRFSKGREGTAG